MQRTAKTTAAIADFMAVAAANGVRVIAAALGADSELVRTNRVKQIRVIKDRLAYGFDELGNVVALCADGFIRQFCGEGEPRGHVAPAIVIRSRAEVIGELAHRFGKTFEFADKFYAAMSTENLCRVAARTA
ncbi:MAG: hypothetical protein RLZZ373_3249 [Pseudomonadota bacterium]|jgi:hypothetical protein